MSIITGDLSAESKDFVVKTKHVESGQPMFLRGTIHAASGATLELHGDLGLGFVKLQDIEADTASILPEYHAKTFRVTGSGEFVISSPLLLEEVEAVA